LSELPESAFLSDGFRMAPEADDVIVVEGFPAVCWPWEPGHEHTVGLMGSSCSDEQARLIVGSVAPNGRVLLLPDGDAAGARCAVSLFLKVAPHRFTCWVKLDHGKQPTDYTAAELTNSLKCRAAT